MSNPRHRPKGSHKFTPKQRAFTDLMKQPGMTQTEAARRIYSGKNAAEIGSRTMKAPHIKAELEAHKETLRKAEQKAADKQALKPVVTRRQIEERLWHEAQNAESDSARVTALGKLCDVKGMIINRNLNMDAELDKMNEEELDRFARDGYLPEHNTSERVEPGRSSTGVAAGQSPKKS